MHIEFHVSGSEQAGLGHAVRSATIINALPASVDVSVRFSGDAFGESRLRARLLRQCTIQSADEPAGPLPDAIVLDSVEEALIAAALKRSGGRLISLVHVAPQFRTAIDLLVLRAEPPDLDGYQGKVVCAASYAAVDPKLPRSDAHPGRAGTRSVGLLVTGARKHSAARQLHAAVDAASREHLVSIVMPPPDNVEPWAVLRHADVVLTGPGIAAFECAFVGVPAVYWCFDGVTWMVSELAGAGLGHIETGSAADAVRKAIVMAADGGGLDLNAAGALVDGRGAARVAALITGSA